MLNTCVLIRYKEFYIRTVEVKINVELLSCRKRKKFRSKRIAEQMSSKYKYKKGQYSIVSLFRNHLKQIHCVGLLNLFETTLPRRLLGVLYMVDIYVGVALYM